MHCWNPQCKSFILSQFKWAGCVGQHCIQVHTKVHISLVKYCKGHPKDRQERVKLVIYILWTPMYLFLAPIQYVRLCIFLEVQVSDWTSTLRDLTALHCSAGCRPPTYYLLLCTYSVEGDGQCGAKNLPGLVPQQPRLPSDLKSCPLVKGGRERALLNCYATNSAVSSAWYSLPKQHELYLIPWLTSLSFYCPNQVSDWTSTFCDSTALHCSAGCHPPTY